MLTEAKARAKLFRMVAADQDPCLDADEVDEILDAAATATEWVTGTAYAVGDRVIPTTGNGRVYVCREAGTSDSTEPDWGTRASGYLGRRFTDGDDLVWEDAGPAPTELWDLRAAAHEGWTRKAAKAASRFDVSPGDGTSFKRSQVVTHCERMAERYLPLVVA